jgi:hypothetical protein
MDIRVIAKNGWKGEERRNKNGWFERNGVKNNKYEYEE